MTQERKLVKKLAEIMDAIGYIQKRGYNKFHNYSYATEADISEAVRKELVKHQIMMIPSVKSREVREHQNRQGKVEYIAIVDMEFRFIDGETGEEFLFYFSGEGQDAGDKAIYKAITGTQKYALLKVFQISTGDDPELDRPTDGQQQQQPQLQGVQGGQQQQKRQQQGQQGRQQQNGQQRPQAQPNVNSPSDAMLKAKWQQLFGALNGYGTAAVFSVYQGEQLLRWLEEQIEARLKWEPAILELARKQGATDDKTAAFIVKTLAKGGTYESAYKKMQAKAGTVTG